MASSVAQNARVRPQMESIQGTDCHVLDAETPSGRYTIWIEPNHGYNFAKLHYEKPGTDMVVSNTAFGRFGEAWVPTKMEWEVCLTQSRDVDVRYRQEIAVTEFEIDPNYGTHKPFVMEDVPAGTETLFLAGNGQRVPGGFVWGDGKPCPCLDEETLDYLDRIAGDLPIQATEGSTGKAALRQLRDKWQTACVETPPREKQIGGMPAARNFSASDTAAVGDTTHSLDTVAAKSKRQTPHCGLYCLYLLMKAGGQGRAFSDLVRPEYLDAPNGSTLSGLKKAAEDVGLHAEIVRAATTRVLRTYPHSVILHVKGSETSRNYDHYVLLLAVEGSRAWVFDPPGPVQSISFDELASRWDRKGLVLSSQPVKLTGLMWREKARLFLLTGAAILVLLVASRLPKRVPWPEMLPGASAGPALSVVQVGGLVMTSLVIGLVFHSVTQGGFLVYPEGVISTQRAHASDFLPRMGLETAKQWHEKGVLFVDARQKRDFEAGHVKGAINIPVDANDTLRRNAVRDVSPGDPMVVYCQSVNCSFADIVAGKLRLDGFFNAAILPGGWMEWTTGIRTRRPTKHETWIGKVEAEQRWNRVTPMREETGLVY